MLQYLKVALFEPKESYIARNMKGSHFVFYYALLVLFLSISLIGTLFPIFQAVNQDGQEIAEVIPEFSVQNGELLTDEESFVYQTDTILFFFDSNGSITSETVHRNIERLPAVIGIGMLQNELYLTIDGQSQSLSYNQFGRTGAINQQTLRALFGEIGVLTPFMIGVVLVALYIGTFFNSLIEMLILALFANIISTLMQSRLRFIQNARVVLVASTLPTLLLAFTSIAQLSNPYQFEMRTVFSLVLFGLSISEMKRRQREELLRKKKEDQERRKNDFNK